MIRAAVAAVALACGIQLIARATATPGTQLLESVFGGLLVGLAVMLLWEGPKPLNEEREK